MSHFVLITDPVVFNLFGFEVYWYGISYVIGFFLAWLHLCFALHRFGFSENKTILIDFIPYIVWGLLVGGRLGEAIIYQNALLFDFTKLISVWDGGMSFYGGFIGCTFAMWVYSKKKNVSFLQFADMISCSAPIIIFCVRCANFVNQELVGRETSSVFGIIFSRYDECVRHPSQLYEAFLEGLLVMSIINILATFDSIKKIRGVVGGSFLILYGVARFVAEFFREPDVVIACVPVGQIFSCTVFVAGVFIVFIRMKRA